MNRRAFLAAAMVLAFSSAFSSIGVAADGNATKNSALREQVTAAVEKGLSYLEKFQDAQGFWSTADYPGLTGLVVQAFATGSGTKRGESAPVQKGLKFIRESAKPDGGIYNKGMANYNTAIALTTLVRAGDPNDQKLIEDARKFLISAQAQGAADPAENGGFGYEAGKSGRMTRPDLSNTSYALEALALAREASGAKERPAQSDLNWEAAIKFVSQCQNLPGSNSQKWASDAPENKGGFTYTASGTQEGTRSYGTMTYAGLLSMLHAEVKQDDPRVKAALDWLSRHYTLEENPGQGAQGLYFYYFVMAKGLTAARLDALKTQAGASVAWREELAKKLLSLQKPDGSWVNTDGRWMETNPVLVTAYVINALNILAEGL